jgi:hypothetical protein
MHKHQFNRRKTCLAFIVLAGLLVFGFSGCGSSNPYPTVPISGKITYEDGSLIQADRVQLVFWPQSAPIDPKIKPRQAIADANPEDGEFPNASTYNPGDGAIEGKHKVCVFTYDKDDYFLDILPQVYHNPTDTPLEVEVARGAGMTPRELKVKKSTAKKE